MSAPCHLQKGAILHALWLSQILLLPPTLLSWSQILSLTPFPIWRSSVWWFDIQVFLQLDWVLHELFLKIFLVSALYIFTISDLNLSTLGQITDFSMGQFLEGFVLLHAAGRKMNEQFVNCKVLTRCAEQCYPFGEQLIPILTAPC